PGLDYIKSFRQCRRNAHHRSVCELNKSCGLLRQLNGVTVNLWGFGYIKQAYEIMGQPVIASYFHWLEPKVPLRSRRPTKVRLAIWQVKVSFVIAIKETNQSTN